MALASAPFGVSQNSLFFRPRVKGRIAFSARLLEIGTSPLSRKAQSCCFWLILYLLWDDLHFVTKELLANGFHLPAAFTA